MVIAAALYTIANHDEMLKRFPPDQMPLRPAQRGGGQ
jgi:hypothetical protein